MPNQIDILSVGEAAKFLRVSVRTMQRWDLSGRLKAARSSTNRRTYTRDQLASFVDNQYRKYKRNRTTYTERDE